MVFRRLLELGNWEGLPLVPYAGAERHALPKIREEEAAARASFRPIAVRPVYQMGVHQDHRTRVHSDPNFVVLALGQDSHLLRHVLGCSSCQNRPLGRIHREYRFPVASGINEEAPVFRICGVERMPCRYEGVG